MQVLIVDDEQIGRDSLQALLAMLEFEVATASGAEEAIEVANDIDLDVAIIDWCLSDKTDGFGVADALRKINPTLRVIMISGQIDIERLADDSSYSVLCKPFEIAELLALVRGDVEGGDAGTGKKI